MQYPIQPDPRADQMDPYPSAEDMNMPQPMGATHGTGATFHGSRRGILVTMKKLRVRGVGLTKRERSFVTPVEGDLIIERMHDRKVDFQSYAEIVTYGNYHVPARQAMLLNPEVFSADERGMILNGFEKVMAEGGGSATYRQTWQVIFGKAAPEPPP